MDSRVVVALLLGEISGAVLLGRHIVSGHLWSLAGRTPLLHLVAPAAGSVVVSILEEIVTRAGTPSE